MILGNAGTGKCLAPDTPVRMYDDSIKKVQDIKKDELLMGDDNKPRKVLNVCSGEETMYRIKQSHGDDYIVNEPHILVLQNNKGDIIEIETKTVYENIDILNEYYGYNTKTDILSKLNIEKLDIGKYHGFQINGNGRFLLGDYTVTHNTSVVGEIVKNLKFRNLKFILTGFTGKAVSRLQEVTKEKAYTMHKLIHDAKKVKPEPCDYVIIDEISMVSTELLYDFIKCYPDVNQYLFVGDNKQLQPIDAGSFLDELLKASVVPTYYLTTNHRVKNNPGDGILLNANLMINHDIQYPFEFVETENFQIINGGIENVFDIVQGCYDAGVDVEDIMIISPYKDYVKCLNAGCKKIYNKNTLSANDKYGNIWTVGDKVVLLKNIGQILYNGQQGIVTDVHAGYITINFGDTVHQFKTNSKYNNDEHNSEMNVFKLQHSYANTLHKNQGQEASIVIIFIDERESNFLNQPLLYTALTRGKDIVYIITPNIEMLNNAVCRKPYFRYDNLGSRLKSMLPNITPVKYIKPKISTSDLFKDDPDLQGMEEEEYYDD